LPDIHSNANRSDPKWRLSSQWNVPLATDLQWQIADGDNDTRVEVVIHHKDTKDIKKKIGRIMTKI
jgi:hypothetical protein